MTNQKIGFIGGGNMARSLIGGLIADGVPGTDIWVSDPAPQQRELLAGSFSIHTTDDNLALVEAVDVVVLAVKPQVMAEVCRQIGPALEQHGALALSIAAGVELSALETWLGGAPAVVRTMPNTPSLVQSGATALIANDRVTADQRQTAENIMRAVGLTLWLDEEAQMDAVTALSGSGPAYIFLVMEALETAGSKLGLPERTAQLLALQTAFGASKMALESREDAATLRRHVTSPGGTTERAIEVLESRGLRDHFEEALTAARDRARELARILGEQG